MKLALQIAVRFLKSSKLQTLTIMLGIAVGVSVQIFIGSLIGGLQKDLVDTAIGSSSQITIRSTQSNQPIDDYNVVLPVVENADDNLTVVSPVVEGAGTAINESKTQPVILRGFDFSKANSIYKFDVKMIDGNLPSLVNHIAIGQELATSLEVEVGDSITLQVPLIGQETLIIDGIYDFGSVQVNRSWVLSTLATAQGVFDFSSTQASAIEMQVRDVFTADVTANQVETALASSLYQIDNWKDLNADLLSGLQGQSTSSLMIQVFVMISVVLGIASVLAITVMQKSKQIGILKAMGLKDNDASYVFLFEGAILGFFGAVFGVGLGLGLSYAFTTFALDASGNPIINLFIDSNFVVLSAVIATIASILAALIPARKSSKISIIEVIRNG